MDRFTKGLRDSITNKISYFRPLTGLWAHHCARINNSLWMCANINHRHITSLTCQSIKPTYPRVG